MVEEFEDGSILVRARVNGPRWIPGTLLRVQPEHIKGYAEQSVVSAEDARKARET